MNPLKTLRNAAKRVRNTMRLRLESALHPRRHQAATQQLLGMERPRSIIVICYGNICRSPYLEAVLRQALPDVEVSSAGFVGAGRGVPDHSLTLSERKGLDLSRHLSQVVTRPLLDRQDLAIVMDERQARMLHQGFDMPLDRIVIAGDLDPESGLRAIRDPWRQPLHVFESSFTRLERIAAQLVSIIGPTP